MAWEEWESAKEAVAQGRTGMRLNEAGPGGADAPDLGSGLQVVRRRHRAPEPGRVAQEGRRGVQEERWEAGRLTGRSQAARGFLLHPEGQRELVLRGGRVALLSAVPPAPLERGTECPRVRGKSGAGMALWPAPCSGRPTRTRPKAGHSSSSSATVRSAPLSAPTRPPVLPCSGRTRGDTYKTEEIREAPRRAPARRAPGSAPLRGGRAAADVLSRNGGRHMVTGDIAHFSVGSAPPPRATSPGTPTATARRPASTRASPWPATCARPASSGS